MHKQLYIGDAYHQNGYVIFRLDVSNVYPFQDNDCGTVKIHKTMIMEQFTVWFFRKLRQGYSDIMNVPMDLVP